MSFYDLRWKSASEKPPKRGGYQVHNIKSGDVREGWWTGDRWETPYECGPDCIRMSMAGFVDYWATFFEPPPKPPLSMKDALGLAIDRLAAMESMKLIDDHCVEPLLPRLRAALEAGT